MKILILLLAGGLLFSTLGDTLREPLALSQNMNQNIIVNDQNAESSKTGKHTITWVTILVAGIVVVTCVLVYNSAHPLK